MTASLSPQGRALLDRLAGDAQGDGAWAGPPRIQPRRVDGPVPLSFAQQRLYFLAQVNPENPFYNVDTTLELRGRLDVRALHRAINEVVRRHEALRTRFGVEHGAPMQVVAPSRTIRVAAYDLQALPVDERADEAVRLATVEGRRPFDLATGPLLRVSLLRLAPDHHVLVLAMHHIIADGWSMGVLGRELGALYAAFSAGRASPLADLEVQYADFAVWQREWLAGPVLDEQLGYWRGALAGLAPLALPTDRPRPPVQTHAGRSVRFSVDAATAEGLHRVAREEGATLFMVLLAAFGVVLGRYAGQEDVAVGSPIANRNRTEIEGLIGFFVNTLVMRVDLSGDPSFAELVRRVREMALGAYAHQDLPFEKLVEELAPERDLARNPLFQVMFALQNAARPDRPLDARARPRRHDGDLEVRPLPRAVGGADRSGRPGRVLDRPVRGGHGRGAGRSVLPPAGERGRRPRSGRVGARVDERRRAPRGGGGPQRHDHPVPRPRRARPGGGAGPRHARGAGRGGGRRRRAHLRRARPPGQPPGPPPPGPGSGARGTGGRVPGAQPGHGGGPARGAQGGRGLRPPRPRLPAGPPGLHGRGHGRPGARHPPRPDRRRGHRRGRGRRPRRRRRAHRRPPRHCPRRHRRLRRPGLRHLHLGLDGHPQGRHGRAPQHRAPGRRHGLRRPVVRRGGPPPVVRLVRRGDLRDLGALAERRPARGLRRRAVEHRRPRPGRRGARHHHDLADGRAVPPGGRPGSRAAARRPPVAGRRRRPVAGPRAPGAPGPARVPGDQRLRADREHDLHVLLPRAPRP